MRNKYIFRSRISEKKFREIIRLFIIDIEATKISMITGITRKTINRILFSLRTRISKIFEQECFSESGVYELDECYVGARRVRGKRGRGAFGKTIVFGIYERKSRKVYSRIVENVKRETLMSIITQKISSESTVYTDRFKNYSALKEMGYTKHETVEHGANEFVRGSIHVNGIEGFWSVVKTRLSKFRGIRKSHIYLHLKECEYRFNHRHENMYDLLLLNLRKSPLKYS